MIFGRKENPGFGVYPKCPPPLSPEQVLAREQFMLLWHEDLPKKYGIIEKFNHGFPASLKIPKGCKTLEVGAGIGEHLKYEDLAAQDYYCLEYREEFCKRIREILPADRVVCGDIQKKLSWEDGSFDRIIAIHVLEHLRDLPAALCEMRRLLKPTGMLDIVIPCDGEFIYHFARKVSSERMFKKNFNMDFTPIIRNEHVSSYREIHSVLGRWFRIDKRVMFPFYFPLPFIGLVEGVRLCPRE